MYLAGGGIMAHPGGPGAGVAAIRQAWEAAVQGIPLERRAAHRDCAKTCGRREMSCAKRDQRQVFVSVPHGNSRAN